MGLFDAFKKKNCDICGNEIKLLGNRKLEDGNMCKTCANKLSPWFDERRHSTIAQINEQLKYREENLEKVKAFRTTLTYGDYNKIQIDEDSCTFMVVTDKNILEENPDVLAFSDITGCSLFIDEDENEIMREGKDGESISYNPPRFEYDYDFYIKMQVRNPYFDEIKFKLNNYRVHIEDRSYIGQSSYPRYNSGSGLDRFNKSGGTAILGQVLGALSSVGKGFNPCDDPEFARYKEMGDNIVAVLMQARKESREREIAAATPKAPIQCPYCGAVTTPDERGCCEFCGASL